MKSLIQILNRIKAISEAHKQIRSYEQAGLVTDFENDHTRKYPAVTLITSPGSIGIGKTSFSFTITFIDLVNVASDTKLNETDVVSDMVSIAEDVYAQMKNPDYDDWVVRGDGNLNFTYENGNDMTAGVALDFTIEIPFTANRCQVPSEIIVDNINDEEMGKPLYDLKYIADGTESNTLDTVGVLEIIKGKKIVLITREMAPLHRVSNLPDPAEFTWNDLQIGLGTATNNRERFLILYRNY